MDIEDYDESCIKTGFDKQINYNVIKPKLISELEKQYELYGIKHKSITIKRITYLIIACIQLRCASRISEAVKAFGSFIKKGIENKVVVKISKSDAIKKTKDNVIKKMDPRYRYIVFPNWFKDTTFFDMLKQSRTVQKLIEAGRLNKQVLDYLRINFQINTHTLRYSCINYLLYDLKRPISDVAKYAGHKNTDQIVRYTSQKNVDQINEIDM